MNIFSNTKISSLQQCKVQNVWYSIINYHICKETGKHNPHEEKNKTIETDPGMTEMGE